MKKKLLTFVASLTLIFAILLTGCVNQDMADKINAKAVSSEGYTYEQLLKDYKNPTIDTVTTVAGVTLGGTVIYVKGCKTAEDVEAKSEKGEKLDAVYVVIIGDKVSKATYKQYAPEE